jgi:long-chain acyl-CoA synthetase
VQLESFLEESARRYPDKTALVCGRERLSYAQIEAAANRLAWALTAHGVARGDRVAVHLDNSVEAVVAIFAILKAGAVFLMINASTKTEKLAYILDNCRARALVLPSRKIAGHAACWAQTPHLETLIAVGEATVGRGRGRPGSQGAPEKIVLSYSALMNDYTDQSSPPPKQAIDVDLAALVYTSGSTGHPKGVMLTHLNMVSAATSITTYLENTPDDVILNVLPLAFDYGLYQVLMGFKIGGTVVLERSLAYLHAVMQRVVDEGVTGLPLVPTMLAMLLQMDLTKYDLTRLRYVSNTGAALPVDHIRRLHSLLPHVAIYSMYGLTECKRVSYLPPDQIDVRPDSVGRGMPNEEVYIVDDAGRRVGPGVVGELVVRGSNVMKGYWESPEATDRVLRPGPLPGEKVLYTGDLFRADDEGYLYFVGRRDDIIKSRGEKVAPREVENVLCRHPAVAEAAVVGVDDEILGQAIKAVVAVRQGCTVTERELLHHCASHLEDFMVPQVVELRDALPRTSNGKIDKRALEAEPIGAAL